MFLSAIFQVLLLAVACSSSASSPDGTKSTSPEGGAPSDTGSENAAIAVPLPRISFELDPTFACRVSTSDPKIVAHLRDTYGVEIANNAADLAVPGPKVKFLPDSADPTDGLMQVPLAVWDEAIALLPTFAATYDTSRSIARGTTLLRRIVDLTNTPFSFTEKTLLLYLCPDIGAAYNMTHWPFYPYLQTVYAPADAALRWTERDFTDWYMLHELGHWYTFDQPYLRKWTPTLDRVYQQFAASDPEFLAGDVWVPAMGATPCRDAYPNIFINMNNLLSHLHINALRRQVLEPAVWEYVKQREKTVTADRYYASSIDVIQAMSDEEVSAVVAEITSTRVPPGCSVLPLAP